MINRLKASGVGRLLAEFWHHHSGPLLLATLSMGTANALQGLTVALLLPLVGVKEGGEIPFSFVSRYLEPLGIHLELRGLLILLVVSVALESAVRLFQLSFVRRFIGRFVAALRVSLYDAYIKAGWPFWLERHSGRMTALLTTENMRVETTLQNASSFLNDALLVTVLTAVAFRISWPLTLAFFAGGLTLLLLLEVGLFGRRISGYEISQQHVAVQEVVSDHLQMAKFIKASGLHDQSLGDFDRSVQRLHHLEADDTVRNFRVAAAFNPTATAVMCGVFFAAVMLWHVPTAKALVSLFIFFRLSTRLAGLQQMGHVIVSNAPAYRAIVEDRETARRAAEKISVFSVHGAGEGKGHFLEFRQVTFGYVPGESVLHGVSLAVPAGSWVAIVGESGGGKSTLLDLATGLLLPDSGEILVGGEPLQRRPLLEWRRSLGYVGQESVLFFDTIANNVRWGFPAASEDDVREACRRAFADSFIRALPKGYDTVVGNRGVRLSGGERQRIALARALLRSPHLLLLDEPTSALDAESENLVKDAIASLKGRVSLLLVTHRLSLVQGADKIYVFKKGQVAQEGNWSALVAVPGVFRDLWQAQGHSMTPPKNKEARS